MDISKFLDLADELELEISKLYQLIADDSGDQPIASRLRAVANEEVNHANTIRRGKSYYEEHPDLFSGLKMDENELRAGLDEIHIFRTTLGQAKVPLVDRLKKLLDL
jgi:bacterioferritin (cytochrome b1)